MKKIFVVMMATGLILAAATAGGMDTGALSMGRILLQGLAASMLMLPAAYWLKRGEAA